MATILSCISLLLFFVFAASEGKVIQGDESPGSVCEIENGVKGTCETVSSCLEDGGVLRRNGVMKMCSSSGGEEYVCCRRPYQIADHLCGYWKSYWRDNNGKCIQESPLIVGGEEAKLGQFPELGILGIRSNSRTNWICGSTLLSPQWVLTAAHCVLEIAQYVVKFGEHNIFLPDISPTSPRVVGPVPNGLYEEKALLFEKRISVPTEQLANVEEQIIHPEYDGRYNDLALLRLERPVVLTKRVLPACLPTTPQNDYMGQRLTVAGWGRIKFETYKFSETLQKVNVPVIDRMKCFDDLMELNARLIPKGIPHELICAGESGKDSCKGDSGGPLLLQIKEGAKTSIPCEHTIAGVVSFGSGCGRFGLYGRVSSYVDWITGYIAPGTTVAKPNKSFSFANNPIYFPN